MEFVLFSLFNGAVYGLLLFMLSSGLTLIFSMMGVLNFAHASFYMLGAYFAFRISAFTGFWPALIIAPLLVGLLGAMVERYGLRRVHRHGHVAELLFTFGLAFVIEELVQIIFGRLPVNYQVPDSLNMAAFTLFNTNFPAYRVFMMGVSISMFLFLFAILTKTRIGLIIQAALSHPDTAATLGHNVPRVFMIVFGVGTGLAGLAGVIGGNAFVTEPGMARLLGSIVFVVVVFGGLGSLTGALIASLLIGILQTFAVALDYSLADLFALFGWIVDSDVFLGEVWQVTGAQVAPMLPYLLLVLILIVRPRGLLGKRDV